MNQLSPGGPSVKVTQDSKPGLAVPAGPAPDLAIAGVIGAELSDPVHAMRRLVQGFRDTGQMSSTDLAALSQAIDEAGAIARQSQQLARLAGGRLRQSHERVSLDHLVETALRERQPLYQERGIEVHRTIKPVEIIVDPGLLSNLVETALDWALPRCDRLVVSLGINSWPEHGLLSIKACGTVSTQVTEHALVATEPLKWHLVAQIARAMGVIVSRDINGSDATLFLEFARTVKHLEGLTAMEIESHGSDSESHAGTQALAGLRILLISDDAAVREEVESACLVLGLVPDTVTDSEKAVRYTERDQPHMIIVDERVRDQTFDDLMQDIRRLDPNFGLLEITDDADTFEISSWMSDSMTRVSRDVLRQHLPSVLTLELAKAF